LTTGGEAPVYDSEYAAKLRLHGTFGNAPESDARPGEYRVCGTGDLARPQDHLGPASTIVRRRT